MKICIHCHTLTAGKGGAERVAAELAGEMASRGHDVSMLYKQKDGVEPSYNMAKAVRSVAYGQLPDLSNILPQLDPDVFLTFYFDRMLARTYAAVHHTNIPFCMQECTNPERLYVNNWKAPAGGEFVAYWEREIIASFAARIRLTMRSYIQSFAPHIRKQIRAFSNPAFRQDVPANVGIQDAGEYYITIVNGFKKNKNLLGLLQAFQRLVGDFPSWGIKVIGRGGDPDNPHDMELSEAIRDLGLASRVHITGQTDDVYVHYRQSQIHVIASLSEGCPTAVLEAMSVGVPSIGFADCPGTNELIVHEENGLLADPTDRIAGLEAALRRLMSSAELRVRLGEQSFKDSQSFEPSRIYDQWEELFAEAASYKGDLDRLFREQLQIAPERALHARRMIGPLLQQMNTAPARSFLKSLKMDLAA